jgi:anti-sigma B factor antagonist
MSTICRIEAGPELNIVHAAETRQSWLSQIEAAHEVIELDASGVQEIDSAGMQLLLATMNGAGHEGKLFKLVKPSRPVRDVIDIFGLSEHFAQP